MIWKPAREPGVVAMYDGFAEAFDRHAASSAYNAHDDRPALLAMLGDVRGLSVLDAGSRFWTRGVEPQPADSMAAAYPDTSEKLAMEPGFIAFSLMKHPRPAPR